MEVLLTLPDYYPAEVFEFYWTDDFRLEVDLGHSGVVIKANKEGLVSLATHLLTLAQDHFQEGFDLNYTADDALEPGSIELKFVKLS